MQRMHGLRLALTAATAMVVLLGCASSSDSVKATYVSPIEYSDYTCRQLRSELRRVSRGVADVSGQQDDAASRDAWAMGVGLVLFWPALFFITPDDQAEELGRLKGKYEALESAAIRNDCDVADEIRIARAKREAERKQRRVSQDDEFQLPGQDRAFNVQAQSADTTKLEPTPESSFGRKRSEYQQTAYAREPAVYDRDSRIDSAQAQEVQARKDQEKIGESSFLVEQAARSQGCVLDGVATLLSVDPPAEIYQQKCSDNVAMIFRCEYRQCIELR